MQDRLRILKSTGSKSRCSIFPKAASSRRKNRSLGEASVSRILRYAVLAYLFLATQLNLAARDVPLAAGNLLQCTLDEPNLSPRTVKVGDPIVCYARPEQIFGCSLFPRGTQWAGRFVEYKDPGRFVGKGWIRLDFDRLILPNGIAPISARVISVRGFKVDAEGRILGHGHPKRDAAGWAVPVLWPEKLITLPLRGPRPALKGERLISLRLLDDVRLPCAGAGLGLLESEWRPFKDFGSLGSGRSQLQPFDSFGSIIPFDSSSRSQARSSAPDNSSGFAAADVLGTQSAAQTPSTDDKAVVVHLAHYTLRVVSSWPRKPGPRTSRSSSSLSGTESDARD